MSSFAVLFPGQGSQEPHMGRDLAEKNSEIMDIWKKAERISQVPLRDIYWSDENSAMAETRHLQPALTVVNCTVWMQLSRYGAPCCTAGHSLGEYSALVAAGVLSLDAVLELVSLRGRLMSEADPQGKGAMAAVVKLSVEQVEELVAAVQAETGECLVVANYNSPAQTVVSGSRVAITRMQEAVKPHKGRAIPLSVSGAFHSPLMQEAATELAQAITSLGKGQWNNARFPVYVNASGVAECEAAALRASLIRQMTSPVFWVSTIKNQWDAGVRNFIECGPKGVLAKLTDLILQAHTGSTDVAGTVRSVGTAEQVAAYINIV